MQEELKLTYTLSSTTLQVKVVEQSMLVKAVMIVKSSIVNLKETVCLPVVVEMLTG